MERDAETTARIGAGIGAVLLVAGAYLPWYRAGDVTRSGIAGDGAFTFVFGCLIVGILLFREWGPRAELVVAGFGGLTLLVAGVGAIEVSRAVGNELAAGLLATLAGGVLLLAVGAYGYAKRSGGARVTG